MKRRELLKSSAALGIISAFPFSRATARVDSPAVPNPLKPPAQGSIPVAFLISDGAVLIDFIGPWEVFGSVMIHGRIYPGANWLVEWPIRDDSSRFVRGSGHEVSKHSSATWSPVRRGWKSRLLRRPLQRY